MREVTTFLGSIQDSPFQKGVRVIAGSNTETPFRKEYESKTRLPTGEVVIVNVEKDRDTGKLRVIDAAKPMTGVPIKT